MLAIRDSKQSKTNLIYLIYAGIHNRKLQKTTMTNYKNYRLYIGSNNDTKQLESEKIKTIVGKRHNGFSYFEGIGSWMGNKEQSCIVEISDNPKTIHETMEILKRELNQDAIGYIELPSLKFI